MRKFLSRLKEQIITLGGFRSGFSLFILGHHFNVGYSLRSKQPDRDYAVILQLAKGKQCIFDVGANHGIISLLLASSNPKAFIHAFEASEEAVNIINKNIYLNDLSPNVRVINTLVADRSGYAIPFYSEGSSGGASIVKGRLGHNVEIYKSTLSLDDYVSSAKATPDFIKMDIEGAENIAIKGMKDILRNFRPTIFIELHEFQEKKLYENAQDILDFVSPMHYLMVYLRTGKPIENATVLKDRGRCHVVLLPQEKYSASVFESLDLQGL
ncbi:MAG: FkbM family methyltransferase [Cyclobacteriaceae bacterium]|nr:FkbM family methyltransferase [Cyclobacteriaceae bacterium]